MDAAILLGAIAGRDEHDPATWSLPVGRSTDYTQSLDPGGLSGARIGIHRARWEALTGATHHTFDRLLSALEDAGATIVEVEDASQLIRETEIDPLFFCEFKSAMNAYLATLRADLTCTSLQEIIEFNQQHAEQALKYGQPMLLLAQNERSGRLIEPEYLDALARRTDAIRALDNLLDGSGGRTAPVDVLLCTQPEFVAPSTGFPSMTLPIGTQENQMPIGAYWIARRYDEPAMLRIAFAAERALGIQCMPGMLEAAT